MRPYLSVQLKAGVRLLNLHCMNDLKNMAQPACRFGGLESHGEVRKIGGFMLGFDRITFDPHVMGGRACIRGMRISVSLLVNLVANGMTNDEIIDAYPYPGTRRYSPGPALRGLARRGTVHPLEPVHP